jgi:16S rRNA (adenine1518-N6/adenine1519-N6)-dimethyltransferase
MTPKEIKKQLEELGIRATSLRGQHFLIDTSALHVIVEAAELQKSDTVFEIGPGLGVLTRKLLDTVGRVVAVELDHVLAKHLEATLGPHRFELIEADIRDVVISKVLGEKQKKYKLVANIPYNITSTILEQFLLAEPAPRLCVLLVQREVAERIVAIPPKMSRLAVFVQYFGKAELVRRILRGAFWPVPKVDSAVLRIRRYPDEVLQKRESAVPRDEFFRIVQAGFFAPRKKLIRNLCALGFDKEALASACSKAKIDRDVRAESVSIDQWLALAEELNKKSP